MSARATAATSSARPRTRLIPFTLKSFPRHTVGSLKQGNWLILANCQKSELIKH
jgi:hypothetical protein